MPMETTPLQSTGNSSKEDDDLKERMTCPVCLDEEKTVAFMCGHSYCEQCSQQLKECAICKQKVTGKIRLFN